MSNPLPVQSGYDRWARVYDHDANPLQALEEPIVRDAIGNVDGLKVLDLGCGTGRHALRLAAAGADVTAVDFSVEMLAEAKGKKHADKVAFTAHDLSNPLPFEAAFDVVVCGLVLEHIEELAPFFIEAARVLKPSGQAVVSFMHPAMFSRGTQARFNDPDTDELHLVESVPHSVSDAVMAALRAGFEIRNVSEHSPDAELANEYPRAAKYVGWPMLVVLSLYRP